MSYSYNTKYIYGLITLALAIAPVYLIILFIYKKDGEKESRKLLRSLFLYGMLSCLPAIVLEVLFKAFFGIEETGLNIISLFFYVFLGIAFVEEICKWFFVKTIAYNHPEFDHIYDAVVYSVYVSLGFALLENVCYVCLLGGFATGLIRAITAVPCHAINAIFMGEELGIAKQYEIMGNIDKRKRHIFLSILIPTVTHGAYDFLLYTGSGVAIALFVILLVFLYIFGITKVKRLSKVKYNLYRKELGSNMSFKDIRNEVIFNFNDDNTHMNFCPKCGTEASGDFCTNCGMKLIYGGILNNEQKPEINSGNDLTQ